MTRIPEFIEDLWRAMEYRGRRVDALALLRLVKYWAKRTPFTQREVCEVIQNDLANGRPVGLKKHGWK